MKESVLHIVHFATTPEELYKAWLDSEQHSAMTGGEAECSDQVGADFTTWDGYITGKNLELEPNKRILQNWRTVEFNEEDEDSILEVLFESKEGGTELKLIHTHIPEGQTQYEQGWIDSYFSPMREYFEN